ncbi:uncharacterized protein L969DRAFT_92754 [Mixia osmundae IAM 14324]|uniref:Uncharacterized protein n=1 Tax=Mixia osmundae (strain CBS 9802 / IAM 14324 / JCM 22182 / KY 12970) TaxID=764103 RepID=G7DYG4_MIXOS|nr:uncharacterized protein L969DRAFT_92754 [Mixia osmundae IAM 14324]KEI41526.1 hypothetical protein L969DRAFT_92754 [Mixia osmundae IAM 14324]GAA95624.1 hypothetical protein E5Q_02280 [Mixia osmundae IAM 14324]
MSAPIAWHHILKYIIVGNSGCGKSSILVQLTDKRFLGAGADPTIGVEYGSSIVELPNGKLCKIQIWDTAGQESFRSITRSYYRGAEGALLVFDVTHRSSFLALQGWLDDLRTWGEEGITILVVGNKVDLVERAAENGRQGASESVKREVSENEAREWAQNEGLEYLETSAKTGENVERAFKQTATEIHAKIEKRKIKDRARGGGSSFPLTTGASQAAKGCC